MTILSCAFAMTRSIIVPVGCELDGGWVTVKGFSTLRSLSFSHLLRWFPAVSVVPADQLVCLAFKSAITILFEFRCHLFSVSKLFVLGLWYPILISVPSVHSVMNCDVILSTTNM